MYDVVVVGGGLSGLTAAWELRDRDLLVLEASDRLGGRIHSERRGDYWLNFGAHVFGSPESATGQLLTRLGVSALPVPGRLNAVALNGKIVSSGAVESLPFRLPMSLAARLALVRTGIKLRLAVRRYTAIAETREGEDAAARQLRMLTFLDDRSFTEFTGQLPADVDALFRSTVTRSSGDPEELAAGYGVGYFHLVWNRSTGLSRNIIGGSSFLIDSLAPGVGAGRIRARVDVTAVIHDKSAGAVSVRYLEGGEEKEVRCRAAIVTTPAYVTRRIVGDLPPETAAALAAIPYGPYVVGAFLTNESSPMPWDSIYALATPKRSFNMLFNTANVLRDGELRRRRGGSLMVYAAATAARRIISLDDSTICDLFLADLHALYPQTRGIVEEVSIRRWEHGLPYPAPGRSRLQAPLTRSLEPIYLAGDYLGTWYTETAVQTAMRAADEVRRHLTEVPSLGAPDES